jgi:hypothetical protein
MTGSFVGDDACAVHFFGGEFVQQSDRLYVNEA